MTDFKATHRLRVYRTQADPVELTDLMLAEGVLYTREEWDSETTADWELCANGLLLWQGSTNYPVAWAEYILDSLYCCASPGCPGYPYPDNLYRHPC